METTGDITVDELQRRLQQGETPFILDVRNPEEFQICRIPGSHFLPLPQLPQRYDELDKNREMVVHCKSGMRSAKAIAFLKQQGFTKLRNLKGGILAWADRIDKSMPKY
jgi:sulfur-carrier protein adenylyltransferase/sulfurtransferase